MITSDKTGGRTVHLFIPFDYNGKPVTQIVLAPLRFGHVLKWNEGAWKSMLALLVDMAGVDEAVIRELRYPDADRVMDAFMGLLTAEIREDIINGRIPQPGNAALLEQIQEAATRASSNGGDGEPVIPMGPGMPLPEAGFDLSEEP